MDIKERSAQPTITPTIIRIAEKFDKLSLNGKAEVLAFIFSLQNGIGQSLDELQLILSKSA